MDVFTAVADPTRRTILEVLGEGGLDAGSIASRFTVSQPAVSRHLRVLREARLVDVEEVGRRRVYRLRPDGLDEMEAWVERYRSLWASRLDELARRAEAT
jgi:DNA-binding transcriptional ArsR family regulator